MTTYDGEGGNLSTAGMESHAGVLFDGIGEECNGGWGVRWNITINFFPSDETTWTMMTANEDVGGNFPTTTTTTTTTASNTASAAAAAAATLRYWDEEDANMEDEEWNELCQKREDKIKERRVRSTISN